MSELCTRLQWAISFCINWVNRDQGQSCDSQQQWDGKRRDLLSWELQSVKLGGVVWDMGSAVLLASNWKLKTMDVKMQGFGSFCVMSFNKMFPFREMRARQFYGDFTEIDKFFKGVKSPKKKKITFYLRDKICAWRSHFCFAWHKICMTHAQSAARASKSCMIQKVLGSSHCIFEWWSCLMGQHPRWEASAGHISLLRQVVHPKSLRQDRGCQTAAVADSPSDSSSSSSEIQWPERSHAPSLTTAAFWEF